MRKFISQNIITYERFERIEQRLSLHDKNFDKLFEALEDKTQKPNEGIFYDGQIYDAYAKNAINEPTYLMAPVRIVSIYETYNMNTQKFEQLIHKFFSKVCLNVDIFGYDGKRYTPREWFILPLEIIEQVIELIISGAIVNYRYDEKVETIYII